MSVRKKLQIPKKFTDKYGEGNVRIYSFSKLNALRCNCSYEYYLSRILKKPSEPNAYGVLGGYMHDILEDFYNGKVKREDLLSLWQDKCFDFEMSEIKFSSDEEKHKSMFNKYKTDIEHFFDNYKELPNKVLTEREVWIDLEHNGAVCVGYIDHMHKDNEGNLIIEDYKSSTLYKTKEDIHEHQKQLLLYAYYFIQNGISLDKIKIRWLFTKYLTMNCKHQVNVTYLDKGKEKTSCLLRNEWITKLKPNLRAYIKEYKEGISNKDLKTIADKCCEDNSFDSLEDGLRQFVESKFILSDVIKVGERSCWGKESTIQTQFRNDMKRNEVDEIDINLALCKLAETNDINCLKDYIDLSNYDFGDDYVYGEINQENIDNLLKEMREDVDKLLAYGKEECNYEREPITDKDCFYCNCLCGVRKQCKYYKEYLDNLNMFKDKEYQVSIDSDDDILKELEDL